jgi:hypothetical protein
MDMYPMSRQEQKVCEDLFAHIAAINAINENGTMGNFNLLEEIIPFIEKLLEKNHQVVGEEKSYFPRLIDNHLHICRFQNSIHRSQDLAVISYLIS